VKGKYYQPISSIAPKLTTTTEIDVDSFKICSFHEFGHADAFRNRIQGAMSLEKKCWDVLQNLAVI
jgi:hypothetical protein